MRITIHNDDDKEVYQVYIYGLVPDDFIEHCENNSCHLNNFVINRDGERVTCIAFEDPEARDDCINDFRKLYDLQTHL